MQSTQPLNSAQPPKEADPHDVFAIESILAARADHRAPPLAQDPASQPAAPQVHVAPEISVTAAAPQVEPVFHATDVRNIQVESLQSDEIRVDEIRVDDLKPAGEKLRAEMDEACRHGLARPVWRHRRRRVAALWRSRQGDGCELGAAIRARGAVSLGNASRRRAGGRRCHSSRGSRSGRDNRAAGQPRPDRNRPPHRRTSFPSAESAQLQSMAQDLAAMTRQVEELKANIAQLRTSHAQMAREVAKATDARASEARPPEQAPRPRVAAVPPAAGSGRTARAQAAAGASRVHPACPAIAAAGRRPCRRNPRRRHNG